MPNVGKKGFEGCHHNTGEHIPVNIQVNIAPGKALCPKEVKFCVMDLRVRPKGKAPRKRTCDKALHGGMALLV